MTTNEKEILRPQESLGILWENAQPEAGTESNDLYSTKSPGNCATKVPLIARVVSLRGAKMHRSESQGIFLKFDNKSGYTLATSSSTFSTNVPIFSGN